MLLRQEAWMTYSKDTRNITIPDGLWLRIRRQAVEDGISATELVRRACRRYIAHPIAAALDNIDLDHENGGATE